MKNNTLVSFKNVSKHYFLRNGIVDDLTVLENINFELKKGDRIGLIGKNGAGKTTFLKLVAGICRPTSGEIVKKGKVVTLMNLEDGFELELSGRENILLNGLLVGMSKDEIKKKMELIIESSGVGRFIDEQFFTYSSGMKFRLAFAIAIESQCDVLIMDEIFMSGDFEYQLKMFSEIREYLRKHSDMALIISSHIPIFLLTMADTFLEVKDSSLKKINKEKFVNFAKTRDQKYYRSVLSVDKKV